VKMAVVQILFIQLLISLQLFYARYKNSTCFLLYL
jgi:hypothetical protein